MGKNKDKRKIVRSSLSGKIANGREVILINEIKDYLAMMGLGVVKITENFGKGAGILGREPRILISQAFKMIFILFLFPLISAQSVTGMNFNFDLSQRINQLLLLILFIISSGLYILKEYSWSGLILFLISLFLMFNGINFYVALIIMLLSMLILFKEDKK